MTDAQQAGGGAPDSDRRRRDRERAVVLLVLAVLPWSVQLLNGSPLALRFVWGMASFEPLSVSTLADFLRYSGAPIVFDWLLSAGFFALAVAATLIEQVVNRREGRLVGGLLALSGIANLAVAWSFSAQPGRVGLPVGTVVLWYVAWRFWRDGGGLVGRS